MLPVAAADLMMWHSAARHSIETWAVLITGTRMALRMERARELLAVGDLCQHAIAAACGYADAPTLCRAFRREQGTSPMQWVGSLRA